MTKRRPQTIFPEVRDGQQWIVERLPGRDPVEVGPFDSWGEAKDYFARRDRAVGEEEPSR